MSFRTLLTTLLQILCKIIFNSKCIIESIIGPVDNFRETTKHDRANNHKHLQGKKNQKTFCSPGSAVTGQTWSYSTVILEIWHD